MPTPPNITWLASYPKSGNTWFRVFITNLTSGKEEPVSINELHTVPIASSRNLFDELTGLSASDLSMEEIDLLRPEFYREISRNSEELIFQKVHDAWKLNSQGQALFPAEVTRAVIYFIRDPRDVAVSFAFQSSLKFEAMIKNMANPHFAFCEKENKLYNQLRQELSTWSGHVKSWVDDSKLPLMVMRYEDMIAETYATFKKAVDYLGLEYSAEKIKRALENSDFRQLKKMEETEGFGEKPMNMKSFFREGKSGTYRDYLDEYLVSEIETTHGDVMRRFGYL